MVSRWEITFEEWSNLLNLFRAEDVAISKRSERRLRQLGLIDEDRGIVLSPGGRMLIEHELLLERRNRLQR